MKKFPLFKIFPVLLSGLLLTSCAGTKEETVSTPTPEPLVLSLLRMELVNDDSPDDYGTRLQNALKDNGCTVEEIIVTVSTDAEETMEKIATGEIDLARIPNADVTDECIVLTTNDTYTVVLTKADEALFDEALTAAFLAALETITQNTASVE